MIAAPNNRKQLLDFLIDRWKTRTPFAASEKVFYALCEFSASNNQPPPIMSINVLAQPVRQIEIIKKHIMNILPEADFINYDYEAQAPLSPEDFAELYTEDHKLCIEKVKQLMHRMKIS